MARLGASVIAGSETGDDITAVVRAAMLRIRRAFAILSCDRLCDLRR